MEPANLRALSEAMLKASIELSDLRVAAEWATLQALLAEATRRGPADSPMGRWLYARRTRQGG